jgi:tetratricopeptide (TPR) repeat protein
MEASPTNYELEQLYGDISTSKKQVIRHGVYVTVEDNKEYQLEYKDWETKKQKKCKSKAKELISYENPNYKKARKYLQHLLKKHPLHAQLHTLIGETYYYDSQYDLAYQSFEQAIELNPIDYLARWLMAEIDLKKGNKNQAIENITLAHIYNRNHIRLLQRLQEIYKETDLTYIRNWSFAPEYKLYKENETVVITADGIWLTYGMYKAVWKYEPDYLFIKSQQEITDYLFQQEMEAALGTFMTYSTLKQDDKRVYPAMNALGTCLDEEMVEEYVMYEILLPQQPTLANHITPPFMKRIIEYIATVRSQNHN